MISPRESFVGKVLVGLLLFALYLALAILYASPAVQNFSHAAPGYHGGSDLYQFLWGLWYFKHAIIDLGTNPFLCDIAFYPDGFITALSPFTPLYGLFSTPLQLLGLSLMQCYTILIIWTYAASGLFTYLLIRHFKVSRLVSFLGGLSYAFCTYRLAHVLFGHLNLAATEWAPLYALLLFRMIERPCTKRGALLGLAFLAQLYTSYYYAVFLLLFTLVVLAVKMEWERRPLRHSARLSRLIGLLSALALLWGLVSSQVPSVRIGRFSPRTLSICGWTLVALWFLIFRRPKAFALFAKKMARPITTTIVVVLAGFSPALVSMLSKPFEGQLSARLSNDFYMSLNAMHLIVPHHQSLLWGHLVKKLFPQFTNLSIEVFQYPGLVLIALLVVSLLYVRKVQGLSLWLACCTVFLLAMLGDVFTAGLGSDQFNYFMPRNDTFFMLPIWPLFKRIPAIGAARVSARFGIMLVMCGAVAASLVADFLLSRLNKAFSRTAVGLALCTVCFVDLLPGPLPIARLHVPKVFATIAKLKGDFTVLEFPTGFFTGSGFVGTSGMRDMIDQTVHHKRLIGHAIGKIPRSVLLRRFTEPVVGTLLRLSEKTVLKRVGLHQINICNDRILLDALWAPQFLREYGVHIVVVNKKDIPAEMLPNVEEYIEAILGGIKADSSEETDMYLIPERKTSPIPKDALLADRRNLLSEVSYGYSFVENFAMHWVTVNGSIRNDVLDVKSVELWYEDVKLPVDFKLTRSRDGRLDFTGGFFVRRHSVRPWGLCSLDYGEIVNVGEVEKFVTMDREAVPYLILKVKTNSETVPHFFRFSLDPDDAGRGEVHLRVHW
ncbi:MAG TPA: hypothetical protein VM163_01225 [bacterium]|nr:hypothetical protein [bacterium]